MFTSPAGTKEQQGSRPSAFFAVFANKSCLFKTFPHSNNLVVECHNRSLGLLAADSAGTRSLLLLTKVGFFLLAFFLQKMSATRLQKSAIRHLSRS